MNSTATDSSPHHLSTCPNLWVFYPCPPNMSIAWTYRTPSVHFSRKFGQVYGQGHRCGSVNLRILRLFRELIALYWQIGKDIFTRQADQGGGAKVIERLSRDLRAAVPETKGFSRANVLYKRAFGEAWPDPASLSNCKRTFPASTEMEADLAGKTSADKVDKGDGS
jgi:hypothetical protein